MNKNEAIEVALVLRERLTRWVAAHMGPAARRRFDAESIISSMLCSLCAMDNPPENRQALESWLFLMARWKLSKRLRREFSQRRDARLDDGQNEYLSNAPSLSNASEGTWEVLEQIYDEWKGSLESDMRRIVDLLEQNEQKQSIAYTLELSPRSITRRCNELEDSLRTFLDRHLTE